jgi:hypothetical protein
MVRTGFNWLRIGTSGGLMVAKLVKLPVFTEQTFITAFQTAPPLVPNEE